MDEDTAVIEGSSLDLQSDRVVKIDDGHDDGLHGWSNFSTGEKVAIIIGTVFGVLGLVAGIWLLVFCCCCAKFRSGRQADGKRLLGGNVLGGNIMMNRRWQSVETDEMLRPEPYEPYTAAGPSPRQHADN